MINSDVHSSLYYTDLNNDLKKICSNDSIVVPCLMVETHLVDRYLIDSEPIETCRLKVNLQCMQVRPELTFLVLYSWIGSYPYTQTLAKVEKA